MTFKRFSQLWRALVIDRPRTPQPNPIVMDGCSERTLSALCRASDGDFSDFDKIDRILEARDSE